MPSLVRQPAENPLLRVLAGELALDKGSVSYLENDVLYEMEALPPSISASLSIFTIPILKTMYLFLEPMRRKRCYAWLVKELASEFTGHIDDRK